LAFDLADLCLPDPEAGGQLRLRQVALVAQREALATERKGADDLKAALENTLPEIRLALLGLAEQIEAQGELIEKQAELIDLLREQLPRP
jgi:hypothetical protein